MSEPLQIEIMGQRLTVKSEDGEEHVRSVARYLEQQIQQLAHSRSSTSALDLVLVTALNIASEYWKLQHRQEELDRTIDRMAKRIGARLHR